MTLTAHPVFYFCLLIVISMGVSPGFKTAVAKTFPDKTAQHYFKAKESCAAYLSFRKKTNPGRLTLLKNHRYLIVETNNRRHALRLRLNGVKQPLRWVSKSCGIILPAETINNKNQTTSTKNSQPPQYLLALSWQPSFCESHASKQECRTQIKNRYDASHWSLHGLWPQPRGNAYCGVNDMDKGIDRNKRWYLLAPVKLTQETATALAFVMPGMASHLQRHEWIKHGTCYGTDAETYYSHAVSLTQQINNSPVGELFTQNVGNKITLSQIRHYFDKAFGHGAGNKVNLRCDNKGRISELWINLKGKITTKTKIGALLRQSLSAGTSCRAGIIDAVD